MVPLCHGPQRSPSQAAKSGHQLPCSVSADASHCAASPEVSVLVWKVALGLPGGLTRAAMWPLVESTNRVSPPSSWVLR